jgi:hypothetical protein
METKNSEESLLDILRDLITEQMLTAHDVSFISIKIFLDSLLHYLIFL